MRTTTNTVLCDAEIAPDGAIMVIEDVGAHGVPGIYVHPDIDTETGLSRHALWVHTMSSHECVTVGRRIRVRVLAGSDTRGLGDCAFDGQLAIASGVLAVGDARNPDRQLLFGSPTIVRVSVFLDHQIEVIHFTDPAGGGDFPVSGPSEVTVLLHGHHGFTHAVGNTRVRHPWFRWPAVRYRRTWTHRSPK